MKSSFPSSGGGGNAGLLAVLVGGAVACGWRLGRFLWDGLQAAGSMWVGPLPPPDPEEEPRPMLDAPSAGHPEQLVTRTPLTRAEAELWARFYSDS
ncbi:DUF6059 family protein [Streptomyces jumonjinensis]|uniref:DUF6059 family protein n=1 Tax=Streptomyces jumonjinensis TaxID=1945 RepID=UPI0037B0FFA3